MRRLGLPSVVALGFAVQCLGSALAKDVPIVFVSRAGVERPPQGSRVSPVERAAFGRLQILEDPQVRTLVDAGRPGAATGEPVDVMDPDVAWDAKQIAFSGFSTVDNAWRIYEIQADGSRLRQITRNDRELDLERHGAVGPQLAGFDDLDPCYLPDGRICFVSTRYPGIVPEGRVRTTNLYVVNPDGSGLHRITTERFGADTPAVEPATGRIVYSRWWRTLQAMPDPSEDGRPNPPAPPPIPPGSPGYGNPSPPPPPPGESPTAALLRTEAANVVSRTVLRGVEEPSFAGVNSWFLASINPDGTGLRMYSGFRLDREQTQAYRPSFLPTGEVLALFIHETPFLGVPGTCGLRSFRQGAAPPEALGGPQTFRGLAELRDGFLYASAEAMPDGRLLVTGQRHDGTPGDTDIFLQAGDRQPIHLHGSVESFSEMDAVPLVARPIPPVIPSADPPPMREDTPRTIEEAYAQGSFRFLSENVHFNGPIDMAIPGAPPVGRGLAIEFYMAPQRTSGFPAERPILIRSQPIGADGKVDVELPAGVPLFEILRRPDGRIGVGRDSQIFHVGGLNFGEAGKTARCVGCHTGHTMIEMPEDATFTNVAPSAIVLASSTRDDKPPFFGPQSLVDRRTSPLVAEWAAAGGETAPFVELRWSTPIIASAAIVYAPATGEGILGPRSQVIRAFLLETYRNWRLVERNHVVQPIEAKGTRVPLNSGLEFDTLLITFRQANISGLHEGSDAPALAEVEVIGRSSGSTPPAAYFTRGDANCDSTVNLSDAVSTLASLFQGKENVCCRAAADANADDLLNLTDPLHLLLFLFHGGDPPAGPFLDCGRHAEGPLGCDEQVCL